MEMDDNAKRYLKERDQNSLFNFKVEKDSVGLFTVYYTDSYIQPFGTKKRREWKRALILNPGYEQYSNPRVLRESRCDNLNVVIGVNDQGWVRIFNITVNMDGEVKSHSSLYAPFTKSFSKLIYSILIALLESDHDNLIQTVFRRLKKTLKDQLEIILFGSKSNLHPPLFVFGYSCDDHYYSDNDIAHVFFKYKTGVHWHHIVQSEMDMIITGMRVISSRVLTKENHGYDGIHVKVEFTETAKESVYPSKYKLPEPEYPDILVKKTIPKPKTIQKDFILKKYHPIE